MVRHGTPKIINQTISNSRNYTFLVAESFLKIDNPSICHHAFLLHGPYWSYFDLQTLSLTSRPLKRKDKISRIFEIVLFNIMVSQKGKFRTECFLSDLFFAQKSLPRTSKKLHIYNA